MLRRGFLKDGSLLLVSSAVALQNRFGIASATDEDAHVRFSMITDLHYANKPPAGSRHYRETIAKLEQATAQFEKEKPDFLVCLGDLIDAATDVKTELGYLTRITKEMANIKLAKHYVLGNHCVDTLTKKEFLDGVGQEKSY